MEQKKYELTDIFDLNALQELMDALSQAFEVGIGMRTSSGECIIKDSAHCRLCTEVVWKSGEGRKLCDASDRRIIDSVTEGPYICRCSSGGLTDAGIRIAIDGVHIASILVGQVRLEDDTFSEEDYRAIARRLEIDEEEYLRELGRVPIMSQKKFYSILQALSLIANQLSQLGYSNLHQKAVIGSLENKESLLNALADKDSLTGLWNRHKFESVMGQLAEQENMRVSMISGDANNLKLMNDIFGHEAGDKMLHAIAKKMETLARKEWIVARCGGDEFRVILPGASLATAQDYCERVMHNCKSDRRMNLPLSIAFGAAEWDRRVETLQECFQRADSQMYENKKIVKQKENLLDYILERLYDRQYLYREAISATTRTVYDFAIHLGFNEEGAERVRIAAKYQDIGMIQLPEHFVIRGQSITEEEQQIIRNHVVRGYQMALQFENTHKVADIILNAHENWDGNGYPNGIKGQAIPLEARMMRVIDNYCYWVTPKLKGTVLSHEAAVKRLRDQAGLMYDPDMVEWFISYLDK